MSSRAWSLPDGSASSGAAPRRDPAQRGPPAACSPEWLRVSWPSRSARSPGRCSTTAQAPQGGGLGSHRLALGVGGMDAAMRSYYEQRARVRRLVARDGAVRAARAPGWHEDVAALRDALRALPPARTLDLACGTASSPLLPGAVTGVDQSASMVEIARSRRPDATSKSATRSRRGRGSRTDLRSSHFYGHLDAEQRAAFLASAGRAGDRRLRAAADGGPRTGRSACSTTARATPSTSAGSPAAGLAEEIGGSECSTTARGSWPSEVRARGPEPRPAVRAPSPKCRGSGSPPPRPRPSARPSPGRA